MPRTSSLMWFDIFFGSACSISAAVGDHGQEDGEGSVGRLLATVRLDAPSGSIAAVELDEADARVLEGTECRRLNPRLAGSAEARFNLAQPIDHEKRDENEDETHIRQLKPHAGVRFLGVRTSGAPSAFLPRGYFWLLTRRRQRFRSNGPRRNR